MSRIIKVAKDFHGARLDRFLLKSTGATAAFVHKQIRHRQIELIDEATFRASKLLEGNIRVAEGQTLRVSEKLFEVVDESRPIETALTAEEANYIQSLVIYRDEHIIAINKPIGLSMQAGARVRQHVDRLLPALAFDAADKPRIVHRLDKDTSGVVLLARSMRVATVLGRLFLPSSAREADDDTQRIQKTYIAFCHNVPAQKSGRISNFLTRQRVGDSSDRIIVADHIKHGAANRPGDSLKVFRAVTEYETLLDVHQFSILKLMPRTGRQHQLRVHCAASLRCPIVGDDKYRSSALTMTESQNKRTTHERKPQNRLHLADAPAPPRLDTLLGDDAHQLHLHAAKLTVPDLGRLLAESGGSSSSRASSSSSSARSTPWVRHKAATKAGGLLTIRAPLSSVMSKTFKSFGVSEKDLDI